jgi:hypothetical protein
MSRISVLKELDTYFKEKGRILSYNEYIKEEDAPVRVHIIKRVLGPWGRMERLLGKFPAEEIKVSLVAEIEIPKAEEAPAEPAAVEKPKAPSAAKKA